MADVSFTHKPLDNTRQQIRLITINPESSGEIRCQLKNAYLDDDTTPDYRAVSYEWGPPTPMKRVIVNGKPLAVRQNLYKFFEAFRARLFRFRSNGAFEDEIQWLWVDQVCINQAAIKERNHQVKIMSDIYRRASYVYVWLGPSHMETEEAMKILKCGLRSYYEHRTSATAARYISDLDGELILGDEYSAHTVPSSESALESFLTFTYWERVWIVQEIMSARYIRIMCGDTLVSWDELRRFCLSGTRQLHPQTKACVPAQMMWLAEHALSAKTYTYTSLLSTFSRSRCHDPKDKVYGLQGILAPETRTTIDYAKSTEAVFHDAVDQMLEDMLNAKPIQFGQKLDHLDYSAPVEVVLSAAIESLKIEAHSLLNLPFITTLVELGSQMGLDTQKLYAKWTQESDFEELDDQWSSIYASLRVSEVNLNFSVRSKIASLCDLCNKLAFLFRRFLKDLAKPQGQWRLVDRGRELTMWRERPSRDHSPPPWRPNRDKESDTTPLLPSYSKRDQPFYPPFDE
ncbi:heterokaryon incompatibility protein-domain-containing protein [Paraphoma chrysanthemicola]|uniref:Heterokaryon incompatibility protein-domain-containing protein n=1 Tax=Paraphoma chrysanthemicola TaxID=798071 RepID=A0A8K0W328_9PLEO|nr:heterokaryon incompatibility protein-domain-containing protein [Paraphoma chrysanthemicola]